MKSLVLVKYVPDANSVFRINAEGTWVDTSSLSYAVNDFDRYALEELLALKDAGKVEDPPSFSTADAEAYGPLHLVSKFTTNTPGTNRVHNIHLIADAVDNAVTLPGEVFSINELAGRRTEEKGYLEDCAIVGGAIVCEGHPANIGGGVSQFATTMYNAGFFACYEDVEHRPHSLYFTRYPEGREATLGFSNPDVKIGNHSEAPFVVRTSYTNSTITVRIYGNNGGLSCDAELSERGNVREYETVYVADVESGDGEFFDLAPGQERRTVSGRDGFTVTSTRVLSSPIPTGGWCGSPSSGGTTRRTKRSPSTAAWSARSRSTARSSSPR
ncbi:MAG: VanW family protein [Acidimicrobiia bacterium]